MMRLSRRRRSGAATAAAFAPDSLSGLVLWNKNESLSAGAIATWSDSSGNANTTAIAGSPTVATDAQYGGLLSVPFNGTTQSILTASLTLGPSTMIAVMRAISGDGFLFHRSDGGTNVDYTYKTVTNTLQVTRGGSTSSYNLSANWAIGAVPRTVLTFFDGTHAGHGLRVNGTAQALTNGSGTADPGTATTAQQVDMFGGLATTVGEILIYDRALTLAERVQVEGYLQTKFGHY